MTQAPSMRLTVKQAAEYLGVCKQRITAKLDKNHFPNASMCECGLSRMIPLSDISQDMLRRKRK